MLDFDSHLIGAHSEKVGATPNWKRGFGFHPLLRYLDETGEALAGVLRERDTAERYREWCERRLEEHDLVYLFLDAIYLKLRPEDEPAEGRARRLGRHRRGPEGSRRSRPRQSRKL